MEKKSFFFGAAIFIVAAGSISLYAGQYFQDFSGSLVGTTNFSDGSQLFSTSLGVIAKVQDNNFKELALTESGDPNVSSAFELPDLDPGAPVYAFSVKWNSQVYGSFGNGQAADGFSFNFGQLSSLNLTNGALESGYGTGLCFSVQTYSDGSPGFYLFANGNLLAASPNNPATQWGDDTSTRHFFEVDWNYTNGLSVKMDDASIFANVVTTNFTPHAGDVFVWAARCGSLSEEVRLDNIVVVTGGNLVQAPSSGPYFADGNTSPSFPITNAFDGNNGTYWKTAASSGFAGATVSASGSVLAYIVTSGDSGVDSPHAWTLQGSADNGSSWNSCGVANDYFLNGMETRAWLATNSTAFGAYRLNFSANENGQPTTTIGEMRFYKLNPIAAPPGPVIIGWTLTSTPRNEWQSIASSADGTKLAAVANSDPFENPGNIYISTNSGTDWMLTSAPSNYWSSIASSADGTKLAAVAYEDIDGNPGGIYTSTNSGANWTLTSAPSNYWSSIASSADGTKLAAAANSDPFENPGNIYISTNSGTDWTLTSAPSNQWESIASSADGSKLLAGADVGLYTSTNSGSMWQSVDDVFDMNENVYDIAFYFENWNGVASSADGTKLAAVANYSYGDLSGIITSRDSGTTWTLTSAPGDNWESIASSEDGSKLLAGTEDGLYISSDSGAIWQPVTDVTGSDWSGVASSADGNKLAAASESGNIYIWQLPVINLALSANNLAISWTTNQTGLVLQQTTNLAAPNWMTATNAVTVTNNQYQILVSPKSGSQFFRLGTP